MQVRQTAHRRRLAGIRRVRHRHARAEHGARRLGCRAPSWRGCLVVRGITPPHIALTGEGRASEARRCDGELFVVRHGKAGDRRSGRRSRRRDAPLSGQPGGCRPTASPSRLAGEQVSAACGRSPAVRCIQTLEPLAPGSAGLGIETTSVVRGIAVRGGVWRAARAPRRAVICSHGDVIPDLVSALVRRGMELTTEPDWRKASVGARRPRRRAPDGDPVFTTAAAEPPPTADPANSFTSPLVTGRSWGRRERSSAATARGGRRRGRRRPRHLASAGGSRARQRCRRPRAGGGVVGEDGGDHARKQCGSA